MQKLVYFCLAIFWFQQTHSQSVDNKPKPYRLLNDLNTNGADAFPWLSHDGLRLYYTQDINDDEVLLMASRANLDEKFGQLKNIYLPQPGEIISVWLTADELEIYYVLRNPDATTGSQTSLYYSNRSSTSENFSGVQQIELLGFTTEYFVGPSLTKDKEELYMYSNDDEERSILKLERVTATTYRFSGVLEIPADYCVGPGQLSANGLNYFISLSASDLTEIHYMTRPDIYSPFKLVEKLKFENDSALSSYQPTVSSSGTIVFVTGKGSWQQNDLCISQIHTSINNFDKSLKKDGESLGSILNIYPNPAFDKIQISMVENQMTDVCIIDLSGQILLKEQNDKNAEILPLDISGLSTGTYIIKVGSLSVEEIFKEIIIQ